MCRRRPSRDRFVEVVIMAFGQVAESRVEAADGGECPSALPATLVGLNPGVHGVAHDRGEWPTCLVRQLFERANLIATQLNLHAFHVRIIHPSGTVRCRPAAVDVRARHCNDVRSQWRF